MPSSICITYICRHRTPRYQSKKVVMNLLLSILYCIWSILIVQFILLIYSSRRGLCLEMHLPIPFLSLNSQGWGETKMQWFFQTISKTPFSMSRYFMISREPGSLVAASSTLKTSGYMAFRKGMGRGGGGGVN